MKGGGAIALHDIPAVAEVVRRMYDRAPWSHGEPLEVDADLFHQARDEYGAVLERRGWAVPYADIKRENFLLRGVTVVRAE